MKHILVALGIGLIVGLAASAWAGDVVDQGSPGRQGPWPVTIQSPSLSDGGSSAAVPVKFFCNTTKQSITMVSGVTNVPFDGGMPGRWMIRICNTGKNSGTPLIACTDDGQNPSMSFDGVGESMEVSDCLTYYGNKQIKCISDTGDAGVTSDECG